MNEIAAAIGVWDGASARTAEAAGAKMLCASGFSIAASYGFPDAELYTMTENLRALERIKEASDLPVIADIDTGYGNALNAARTASKFMAAGAAYVFMEDQVSPKECPVSSDRELPLISEEAYVGKVKAIKDRVGEGLKLVARTDAHGDQAIERAVKYAQAGADLIMPVSKTFTSIEEWKRCSAEVKLPMVATLTPSTWIERDFTRDVMRQIGVQIAIYPTQTLMAAAGAINRVVQHLSNDMDYRMEWGMSHSEFSDLIGFQEVHAAQSRYLMTTGE